MAGPSALNTALRKLSGHYRTYVASWFVRDDVPSDVSVTLLVPLAPKDLQRARRSIPQTLATLAHPVDRVVVVSPENAAIQAFCREAGFHWLDELEPLSDLCGADTARDMNGWIRQQMLKMMAPEVTGADRVIAFDSDTFPLRRTRFMDDRGRTILYTGERTNEPYDRFTWRLTGLPAYSGKTFIAHCMLFQRRELEALRRLIEDLHGKPWHQAVLELVGQPMSQAGVMSEFEIFGTFMCRTRPERVALRHRANVKISEHRFLDTTPLTGAIRRFRFASSHIHGG